MANVHVNLLFEANTSSAINNINQLGLLLQQISNTKVNINSGPISQAAQAAKELQVHLGKAVDVNTGKLDLTKFNTSLQQSNTTLQSLSSQLIMAGNRGQQAFVKLANSIAQAQAPALNLGETITQFGKTIMSAAMWSAAYGVIEGISEAFRGSIDYAKDLNKALTDIAIVSDLSTNELAKFTDQAMKAAKALKTTTTEYAEAALIFYQQGLSSKEVEERTNAVIKMAQVTGQTAQVVSDQMTAVWNNFDNGSKSLEYYADVLTALGAATASSTDEITEGLERFAAVAETVGLSYEYAASALATVTAETRQSAEIVGTAFKTLFARIQDLELGNTLDDGVTLGSYSQALEKIGVNALDANGNLREMDDILDDMGKKWDTLTAAQKTATAQSVAGVRQYTQLIALMDNWEDFKINLDIAYGSEGTLEKQHETWKKSAEAAAKEVEQSWNKVYSQVLSDETVINVTKGFADIIEGIGKVMEKMGGLGPMILTIVAAFSHKLIPIIATFGMKAVQAFSVVTGHAAKQSAEMRNNFQNDIQAMINSNQLSESNAKQLQLTSQLIDKKREAEAASKRLVGVEKEELALRLEMYEAMNNEVQALYAKLDAAQQETLQSQNNIINNDNRTQVRKFVRDNATKDIDEQINALNSEDFEIEKKYETLTSQDKAEFYKLTQRQAAIEREINALLEKRVALQKASTAKNKNDWSVGTAQIEKFGEDTDDAAGARIQAQEDKMVKKIGASYNGENIQIESTVNNLKKVVQASLEYQNAQEKLINSSNQLEGALSGLKDEKVQEALQSEQVTQALNKEAQARDDLIIAEQQLEAAIQDGDETKIATEREKVTQATETWKNANQNLKSSLSSLNPQQQNAIMSATQLEKQFLELASSLGTTETDIQAVKIAFQNLKSGKGTEKDIQTIKNTFVEMGNACDGSAHSLGKLSKAMMDQMRSAGMDSQAMKDLVLNMIKEDNISEDLKNTLLGLIDAEDKLAGSTKKAGSAFLTAAGNIGQMASSIQMCVMGFKSFLSIFDETTTAGEKFEALLMSVSTLLPGILMAIGLIKGALQGETKETDKNTTSKFLNIFARKKNKQAAEQEGQGVKQPDPGNPSGSNSNGGGNNSPSGNGGDGGNKPNSKGGGAGIGGWMIAIAALIAIIYLASVAFSALDKAWNKDAIAAEKATEAANKAKEAYDETKQSYEDFKNTISDYDEAIKGLEELIEGTVEYKEKLFEANEAAMKLIRTNSKIKYTIDENGLIQIDKDSLVKAQEEELLELQQAQAQSVTLNRNAVNAGIRAEQTAHMRNSMNYEEAFTEDDWNTTGKGAAIGAGAGAVGGIAVGGSMAAAGATIGAAAGSAVPIVGTIIGAIVGTIIGAVVGSIVAANTNDAVEKEREALQALATHYANVGEAAFTDEGMTEALKNAGFAGEEIEELKQALNEDKEATEELVRSMDASLQAEKAENRAIGSQNAAQMGVVQGSDFKEELTATAGNIYDATYRSLKEKYENIEVADGWGVGTQDAKELFAKYAKVQGINRAEVTDYRKDNTIDYEYYDENNKKQTANVDRQTMAAAVAAAEAMEKLGNSVTQVNKKMADWSNSGAWGQAMIDFVGTQNFSGANYEQLLDLANKVGNTKHSDGGGQETTTGEFSLEDVNAYLDDQFGDGVDDHVSAETAAAYGFTDHEEFASVFKTQLESAKKAWDALDQSIYKGFNNYQKLTLTAAQNFENTYKKLSIGPDSKFGREFQLGINKLVEEAKVKSDDLGLVYEKLSNINWTDWDALEQARDILSELGYEIDITTDYWKSFADAQRKAALSIPDFSKLKKQLTEISQIIKDMELGEAISAEDYTKLIEEMGKDWEKFFVLQADGTYKFIGNLNQVREITRASIKDLEEAMARRKAAAEQMEAEGIEWKDPRKQADRNAGGDGAGDGVNQETIDTYTQTHNVVGTGTDGKVTSDDVIRHQMALDAENSILKNQTILSILEAEGYSQAEIEAAIQQAKEGNGEALNAILNFITNLTLEDFDKTAREIGEIAATSSSSITELNTLHGEGLINDEAYQKGLIALASNYEECADEVEDYWNALNSGDLNQIAIAQERLNKAIKKAEYDKFAEEAWEYIKALSTAKTLQDTESAIRGIQKAFESVFNITIDLDTLMQYKDLFVVWATSSEEASDDIGTLIISLLNLENYIKKNNGIINEDGSIVIRLEDGTKTVFSSIENGYYGLVEFFNQYPIIVDAYGNADFTNLFLALQQSKISAQDLVNMLVLMGQTKVTFSTIDANGIPNWKSFDLTTLEGQAEFLKALSNTEIKLQADGTLPDGTRLTGAGGGRKPKNADDTGGGSSGTPKKLSDEVEKYYEINKELELLEHNYDKLSKARENSFGKEYLKLLDKEKKALLEINEANTRKLEEAKQYTDYYKQFLLQEGAIFDPETQLIVNYDELMAKWINEYNAANGSDEAEETYNRRIEMLSEWSDAQEEVLKNEEEINEKMLEFQELILEGIQYKLEMRIELNEQDLKEIEFKLKNLNDDIFDSSKAIALMEETLENSLINYIIQVENFLEILNREGIGLTPKEIEQLLAGPEEFFKMIEEHNKNLSENDEGYIDINKLFPADVIEKLKDAKESLETEKQNLETQRSQVWEKVMSAYNHLAEELSRGLDGFRHLDTIYNEIKNIVDLVNSDSIGLQGFDFISSLRKTIINNNLEILSANKKTLDKNKELLAEFKKSYEEALANGDEKTIEYWKNIVEAAEEKVKEGAESMATTLTQVLQAASDDFAQAMEELAETFSEGISAIGKSIEEISNLYEQTTSINERNMKDYQKIYELNKLNREVTKSINELDSVKSKRELTQLQTKINKINQSDTKMSEYQLKMLQSEYDLLVAKINLEEAQNAKNQVRMSRDSEGNWSYIYTANEENIQKAQDKYAEKLYERQNLTQERITEGETIWLNAWANMKEEIIELGDPTQYASIEEYYKKVDEIKNKYQDEINYGVSVIEEGLIDSETLYQNDWAIYSELTGYKISSNENWIDSFEETVLSEVTGYKTMENAQDSFLKSIENFVEGAIKAFKEYEKAKNDAFDIAGISSPENNLDIGENLAQIIIESIGTVDFDKIFEEATNAFGDTLDALDSFEKTYKETTEKISQNIENLVNLISIIVEKLGDKVEITENTIFDPSQINQNNAIQDYENQIGRMKDLSVENYDEWEKAIQYYDEGLSESQRSQINQETTNRVSSIRANMPNYKAAADVYKKINSLGNINLSSGDAIQEAENAYNNLTDEQKALVTNYDTLTSARQSYEDQIKANQQQSSFNEEDRGNNYDGQTPDTNTGTQINATIDQIEEAQEKLVNEKFLSQYALNGKWDQKTIEAADAYFTSRYGEDHGIELTPQNVTAKYPTKTIEAETYLKNALKLQNYKIDNKWTKEDEDYANNLQTGLYSVEDVIKYKNQKISDNEIKANWKLVKLGLPKKSYNNGKFYKEDLNQPGTWYLSDEIQGENLKMVGGLSYLNPSIKPYDIEDIEPYVQYSSGTYGLIKIPEKDLKNIKYNEGGLLTIKTSNSLLGIGKEYEGIWAGAFLNAIDNGNALDHSTKDKDSIVLGTQSGVAWWKHSGDGNGDRYYFDPGYAGNNGFEKGDKFETLSNNKDRNTIRTNGDLIASMWTTGLYKSFSELRNNINKVSGGFVPSGEILGKDKNDEYYKIGGTWYTKGFATTIGNGGIQYTIAYPEERDINHWGYIKKSEAHKRFKSLDTGGYTGEWDSSGRLALLHQKEIVLNAHDTENFLSAVNIIREISQAIDLNAVSQALSLGNLSSAAKVTPVGQTIEQEVTIHAEFPNATNHFEIEEAFDNLLNRASQFANRKN